MDITHTHPVPKEMPGYHDLHDIWMECSAYILEAKPMTPLHTVAWVRY
jgi:hypothetical protein